MKATKFIAMTLGRGNKTGSEFVEELYYVYRMQEHIQNIQASLVQITMTKGTEDYQREAAVFSNIPYIILGIFHCIYGRSSLAFKRFFQILLQSLCFSAGCKYQKDSSQ